MQNKVTCTGHVLFNRKPPLARHTIQVPSCQNCEDIECIKYAVFFTKYLKFYKWRSSEKVKSDMEYLTPVSTHLLLAPAIPLP